MHASTCARVYKLVAFQRELLRRAADVEGRAHLDHPSHSGKMPAVQVCCECVPRKT